MRQRYENINDLKFALATIIRTEYKLRAADYTGLFSRDALLYWLDTGKSAHQILRETIGRQPAA